MDNKVDIRNHELQQDTVFGMALASILGWRLLPWLERRGPGPP